MVSGDSNDVARSAVHDNQRKPIRERIGTTFFMASKLAKNLKVKEDAVYIYGLSYD